MSRAVEIDFPEVERAAYALTAGGEAGRHSRVVRGGIPAVIGGEPNDLVAHILDRLGVRVPADLADASVADLEAEGLIDPDETAYRFLNRIQLGEDAGDSWGSAVSRAQCWRLYPRLPF